MSGYFREMLHVHPDKGTFHHEARSSQTIKDNNLVACASEVMSGRFINPFSTNSTMLVNISSGEEASSEFCENLTHIKEIGESALQKCLESSQNMPVVKLKTFASVSKTFNIQGTAIQTSRGHCFAQTLTDHCIWRCGGYS